MYIGLETAAVLLVPRLLSQVAQNKSAHKLTGAAKDADCLFSNLLSTEPELSCARKSSQHHPWHETELRFLQVEYV